MCKGEKNAQQMLRAFLANSDPDQQHVLVDNYVPHILEKPFEVIAILRPGNVICLFSVGSGEVVDGSMIFDPVQELLQEASGR